MSTAFYPQGFGTYGNRQPGANYVPWKGTGPLQNATGTMAGNMRPFTNNDPTYLATQKFGLPRPIKHYRLGRPMPITVGTIDPLTGNFVMSEYNSTHEVRSNGRQNGQIGAIQDRPGGYSINTAQNTANPCIDCHGIKVTSDYSPSTSLTEKPQPNVTSFALCCSAEKKARKRTQGASTNVSKNYYQTNEAYLYNRCQTFDQRSFNFVSGTELDAEGKPLYVGQCVPGGVGATKGCSRVYYNPNNKQYSQQGAVTSSSRNLRLNINTIEKNIASMERDGYANILEGNAGGNPITPFLLKCKSAPLLQNKCTALHCPV